MELNEFKSAWEAVDKRLTEISEQNAENLRLTVLSKKSDIKTRILNRSYISCALTAICLILLATSKLWAPAHFPVDWQIAFCSLIAVGAAMEMLLTKRIKGIDIYSQSNADTVKTVIGIKKHYRNMELAFSIAAIMLFIWLSFSAFNALDAIMLWTFIAIGFTAEYFWFRHSMADYNDLLDWCKE